MIVVEYDKDLYPKVAMIKAAYSLIDRCYIHMDTNGNKLSIQITTKGDIPEEELKLKLDNEILAQTVRYHVYQQTHDIREMLVGRAMASTIVNASPMGDIPQEEYDESLDDILTDWFKKNEK